MFIAGLELSEKVAILVTVADDVETRLHIERQHQLQVSLTSSFDGSTGEFLDLSSHFQ